MDFGVKRMEQVLSRRKFGILLTLVMMIQLSPLTPNSFAATPKKGTLCNKLGQSSGKGTKKVTCTPVTSLRWVATPVKPAVGSIFAPAQMGKFVKVGTTSFRVKSIDFGIGTQICAVNAFNDGCALGPKLEGIVDINIVFAVPKSVDTLNPLFLMRDQSKPVVKDYYFLLDW